MISIWGHCCRHVSGMMLTLVKRGLGKKRHTEERKNGRTGKISSCVAQVNLET